MPPGAGTAFWLRYTYTMHLDIAAVQSALAADGLDGWLLYDFHGSNPVAATLAGLAGTGKMTTRRWYYMIPATGSRGSWCTRSNRTISTSCPARSWSTQDARRSPPGSTPC